MFGSMIGAMPTRNINLTDHLDRFIEAEVDAGRYGNASEVVRDALRFLQQRKREERAKLKWLRGAVKEGLEQIGRGEAIEFGSVEELQEHVDQLWGESSSATAPRQKGA
jgi:antitoxin ParD1/3/4